VAPAQDGGAEAKGSAAAVGDVRAKAGADGAWAKAGGAEAVASKPCRGGDELEVVYSFNDHEGCCLEEWFRFCDREGNATQINIRRTCNKENEAGVTYTAGDCRTLAELRGIGFDDTRIISPA
jgi:hypothetical protein